MLKEFDLLEICKQHDNPRIYAFPDNYGLYRSHQEISLVCVEIAKDWLLYSGNASIFISP